MFQANYQPSMNSVLMWKPNDRALLFYKDEHSLFKLIRVIMKVLERCDPLKKHLFGIKKVTGEF